MERCAIINPGVMRMFEILKKQSSIENIPISRISPNPFQPRKIFAEEELASLGESIRENGLIQPVAVRKVKNGYELISGERRLRACSVIGRENIEAIVYNIGERDSAVWALIENLQRSDLSPFDEAEAIARLLAEWKISGEEAAARLGIASSTLSNKLRILKLSQKVRDVINENSLTERHARELLRIPEEEARLSAVLYIAARKLNVPETERYINSLLSPKKPERKKPLYVVKDLRIFINTFEHAVDVMNCAGLSAVSTVSESEDELIYSVRVPKNKAFRRGKAPAEPCTAPECSACAPSVI